MRSSITAGIMIILICLRCADNEGPEVVVAIPTDGTSVQGIGTVLVLVSDDHDIDSVRLYIDDQVTKEYSEAPYFYSWNTHMLSDSSMHSLFAQAIDEFGNEGFSDTIIVMVYNGPLMFGDDFESYVPGKPPISIWFEIWPGVTDSAYVSQAFPHQGEKSYRSFGYADYVRTDGICVNIANVEQLTYECSLMMPGESENGALFGFFIHTSPNIGEIYNGVMFDPQDRKVHVRGILPDTTNFVWSADTWYDIQVVLDLSQTQMHVWVDHQQVAANVPMADTAWLDTFAISTIYGCNGCIYYDDVRILGE